MRYLSLSMVLVVIGGLAACGSVDPNGPVDGGETCVTPGATRCLAGRFQRCQTGLWLDIEYCAVPLQCDEQLGCVACQPELGRTCVGDEVHECNSDGTIGALVETCPAGQCRNGSCRGDCVGGTDLIYVVDDTYRLLSFNPSGDQHTFTLLGNLSCPAGASWPGWGGLGAATPFSMSVDRTGRAWVLYTSGEIFWVSVTDPSSCTLSPFVKGSNDFELFGMGFVTDTPGGSAETLYVAGGPASTAGEGNVTLGRIDPATAVLTPMVALASAEYSPEFTGTGAAELYGYYPGSSPFVARLNKSTGDIEQQWSLPSSMNTVRAWAFAHWGGRFYIFITTMDFMLNTVTEVQRLDPSTGTTDVVLTDVEYVIVGAGVSTCAPVVVN